MDINKYLTEATSKNTNYTKQTYVHMHNLLSLVMYEDKPPKYKEIAAHLNELMRSAYVDGYNDATRSNANGYK